MIHVNRNNISHPDVFYSREIEIAKKRLEDFYKRSKESRSQERYSKPFEPELRDKFLRALRELFNGKCAYCESKIPLEIVRSEYDHFRPKNGARGFEKEFSNDHYWWLTYEWSNLYYSCSNCNQYKSTWFPVDGQRAPIGTVYENIISLETPLLIDPCIDYPEEHLSYKESGEIDFLSTKGKTTIEILKLNRYELVQSRLETINNLYGNWEYFLKVYGRKRRDLGEIKKIHQNWNQLFTDESSEPYLGIQRYMLSKWLSNNPNIQNYLNNKEYDKPKKGTADTQALPQLSTNTLKPKELLDSDKKIIEEQVNIDSIKHVYIEKIELSNFKCFTSLELNFDRNISGKLENTLSEPWLLFLGENGVGKSSILKALAIGLSGSEYLHELNLSPKDIIKHDCEQGYIKIHLVGAINPIEVHFDNSSIRTSISQPIVNVLGYNSIRLKPTLGKMIPENTAFYGAKCKNLFDYTFSLVDPNNWLATLPKEVFDRAALTLKDLMLLKSNDEIIIEDYMATVVRGGKKFSIDELSDGYKTIFYLAVDIMATLAGENVTFDLAEGMVLIDEIGTHLHPRWRMEVVGRLRKAFPKIRFVVTTHEPLCLRGLLAGEIVVLTINENENVVALTDLPDPSELRIDQILTSEFFGLKSTIDPKTEELFNEYYAILALDDQDRTQEQNRRILELSSIIPRVKHLGDDLRDELAYYAIDELLAKKARNSGLKITEALKEEALKRVSSLWDTIDKKNDRP